MMNQEEYISKMNEVHIKLLKLVDRIRTAGKEGAGVRITAEETHYLLFNNLPNTADDNGGSDSYDYYGKPQ